MAKRRKVKKNMPMHGHHHGKKKMTMGFMIFLFGFLVYWGYTWDIALMAVGALMFLKGLWFKKSGKYCC
jgi:hypothetical protein